MRACEPRNLDVRSPQAELVTGRPLPAAPLTRRLDRPDDAAGVWLRADPVGLVPDLAAVWLQPERRFGAGAWSEAISDLLEEEGLALELTASGRGYIALERSPESLFVPPWALAGSSLDHAMPEGDDARRWRRLLNETQVLLQQHRRSADDPAAIPGSLWFWGGGSLPEPEKAVARVQRIVAGDPVLVGLADWLGLPCRAFEEGVEPRPGDLVEWPSRFEASAEANLERLQEFLRVAWRRLRLGRIGELELSGMETVRRFAPRHAWRIWR
ncbi:hypothetical protein DZC52_02870 [Wenzhouxiangella sediminis]|uniref:Phosphoglycerate mutase n=1 Tax=Wenzhouxiangella sediminis TaxID=1792836 RepID=A0A3E1KBF2_9GAMM|nr:hypothetical protein DZC52_02870 [Wenzhouxiangella sediminis]